MPWLVSLLLSRKVSRLKGKQRLTCRCQCGKTVVACGSAGRVKKPCQSCFFEGFNCRTPSIPCPGFILFPIWRCRIHATHLSSLQNTWCLCLLHPPTATSSKRRHTPTPATLSAPPRGARASPTPPSVVRGPEAAA